MIEIIEVKSKKQRKNFIEFPIKLYKDSPYYVPAFNSDERKIFLPKEGLSKSRFFLAYKDGMIVGRIAGIIVYEYIKKSGRKVMRFCRVDFIDDFEVVKALFNAVEQFAKEEGLDELQGPMGYSDMDREGMLIEGFDKVSTYAENYSHEYYYKHLERLGFKKEVDWVEYLLHIPQEQNPKILKVSELVPKRYKLKELATKDLKVRKFINQYADQIFKVIDDAYAPLHGTIPLDEALKKDIISQFKIFISHQYLSLISNENNEIVGFGVVLPSISKELMRNRGKLTPCSALRLLKIKNNPEYVEFAIIAVRPDYHNKGVNAMIMSKIHQGLIDKGIKLAETNLELEYNIAVQSQWESFDKEFIKRRRCFLKQIQ